MTTIYMAASLGLVESFIFSIALGDMSYGYFTRVGVNLAAIELAIQGHQI